MRRALILAALAGCTSPQQRTGLTFENRSSDRLRAGEADDNRTFDDYLRYFQAYPDRDVRKFDVTDRIVISVVDREGRPVSCRPVGIFSDGEEVYRATTTAGGQVMFPPRAAGADGQEFELRMGHCRTSFPRVPEVRISLALESEEPEEVDLDIAFCLDTTGSMSDEIDRLKSTLRDVVRRIGEFRPRANLRFGMVLYRDRGDEYVTWRSDFTSDLEWFHRELRRVEARAGGDYEEAVSAGLNRAVDDLSWRDGAIRLLFLIGDAPPHDEDPPYTRAMRRAAERGIKIFAIAASGLNDKGEFVWRQLAQFTLGKFMFLSYGGRTSHHVGSYRENNLDDLMVRCVGAELESLRPGRRLPSTGQGRAPDDFREWPGQDD